MIPFLLGVAYHFCNIYHRVGITIRYEEGITVKRMSTPRYRYFLFEILNPVDNDREIIRTLVSRMDIKYLAYKDEKNCIKGYCETFVEYNLESMSQVLGRRANITLPKTQVMNTLTEYQIHIIVVNRAPEIKRCPQRDPNDCPRMQKTIKNLKCELCKKRECEIKKVKYVPPCPQEDPYDCPMLDMMDRSTCKKCKPAMLKIIGADIEKIRAEMKAKSS